MNLEMLQQYRARLLCVLFCSAFYIGTDTVRRKNHEGAGEFSEAQAVRKTRASHAKRV